MEEANVEVKQIGGSLGVLLPKRLVDSLGLEPRQKIHIGVERHHKVGELFGITKVPLLTRKEIEEIKSGWH